MNLSSEGSLATFVKYHDSKGTGKLIRPRVPTETPKKHFFHSVCFSLHAEDPFHPSYEGLSVLSPLPCRLLRPLNGVLGRSRLLSVLTESYVSLDWVRGPHPQVCGSPNSRCPRSRQDRDPGIVVHSYRAVRTDLRSRSVVGGDHGCPYPTGDRDLVDRGTGCSRTRTIRGTGTVTGDVPRRWRLWGGDSLHTSLVSVKGRKDAVCTSKVGGVVRLLRTKHRLPEPNERKNKFIRTKGSEREFQE